MNAGRPPGPDAPQRRAAPLWHGLRAVAWGFLGIRRSTGLEHDAAQLKPVHVIVAGLIGAALFIGALLLLVNWIAAGAAHG